MTGMCYPVCEMVYIKETLLLIWKSSPCGSSGFPPLLSGPSYIYISNAITINKTFPSFTLIHISILLFSLSLSFFSISIPFTLFLCLSLTHSHNFFLCIACLFHFNVACLCVCLLLLSVSVPYSSLAYKQHLGRSEMALWKVSEMVDLVVVAEVNTLWAGPTLLWRPWPWSCGFNQYWLEKTWWSDFYFRTGT